MDGWMDGGGWAVQDWSSCFFGLLGRLSNCCPLSSRFFDKNWSYVPLILLGCVASGCCVDVIIFAFLHMQKYSKWGPKCMKMRPKDPEIERKGCPEPSKLPQRWIKRSQGSHKGVKRPPLTTPMTSQDAPWEPTGHPLGASGSPKLAYRPSFEAKWRQGEGSREAKVYKIEMCKNLKKPWFFNGFWWFFRVQGYLFWCFSLKSCENSISWQKLSKKYDSVAQGSDFFYKNEAQDELKGASEGTLEA